MSDGERTPERFSLKRWSARKLDAARSAAPAASAEPQAPAPVASANPASPNLPATSPPQPAAALELPPVESLTFESDFTAFLTPKVAEPLKRQALKKLFSDPRFNVMDGLDVYIDDYSVPSPIEPELVSQLVHARFTLDPPATRVNAQGHVEDVPPEEIAAVESAPVQSPAAIAPALPEISDAVANTSEPQVASITPQSDSE